MVAWHIHPSIFFHFENKITDPHGVVFFSVYGHNACTWTTNGSCFSCLGNDEFQHLVAPKRFGALLVCTSVFCFFKVKVHVYIYFIPLDYVFRGYLIIYWLEQNHLCRLGGAFSGQCSKEDKRAPQYLPKACRGLAYSGYTSRRCWKARNTVCGNAKWHATSTQQRWGLVPSKFQKGGRHQCFSC